MTVQFIKVTKKDRVCYAPVPEPVEEGDKLEIMEMKDGGLFPAAGKNAGISLSRNPMVFVKMNDGFQRILMKHIRKLLHAARARHAVHPCFRSSGAGIRASGWGIFYPRAPFLPG